MKKIYYIVLFLMNFVPFSLLDAKKVQKCQTQECAYTKINCEECCRAKTGVSPECCAACNNCTLYDDGGRSGCKDFPS